MLSRIQPLLPRSKDIAGFWLSGVISIMYFFHCFYLRILSPTNIDWLMTRGDPSQYYIGWLFFRFEPWGFPLGRIDRLMAPFGTSLGLNDGIPLIALPLKLISPLLPEHFQYFGFWILACHLLTALFAYLLLRPYTTHLWLRLAGVALILINPVMLQRQGGHIALGGQWLILMALWQHLRPVMEYRFWPRYRSLLLTALLAALVHPYLAVMVLAIHGATLLRDTLVEHRLGWLPMIGAMISIGVAMIVLWLAIGTIIPGGTSFEAFGFHFYSANLNTFWNPLQTSQILSELPRAQHGQYEGFGYLGIGGLVAGFLALCVILTRRPDRFAIWRQVPLLLAVGVLALYAFSNWISYNAHAFELYTPSNIMNPIIGSFRSSGRFIWPLYYVIVLGILAILIRHLPQRTMALFLTLLVILQLYEMNDSIHRRYNFEHWTYGSRLRSAAWEESRDHFDRIVPHPPLTSTIQHKMDAKHFAYLAGCNRQSVSAGYVARFRQENMDAFEGELQRTFLEGQPDPRTLYVLSPNSFVEFGAEMLDRFVLADLDGYVVAFDPAVDFEVDTRIAKIRKVKLEDYLPTVRDSMVVVSVRDEATQNLKDHQIQAMRELGLDLGELGYREALGAVLFKGEALWSQRSPQPVSGNFPPGESCDSVTMKRRLAIHSRGFNVGSIASIQIDGQELAINGRGLNICVLDAEQRVVETANFDTHAGTIGTVATLEVTDSDDSSAPR